jgi:hypothetical protein
LGADCVVPGDGLYEKMHVDGANGEAGVSDDGVKIEGEKPLERDAAMADVVAV